MSSARIPAPPPSGRILGAPPISRAGEEALSRRGFLRVAGCAAVAALGAETTTRALVDESTPAFAPQALPDLSTLSAGEALEIPLRAIGRSALVLRLGDEGPVAWDRRCTHLGCPVVWSAEHGLLECPCHGAAFDPRSGTPLYGPPRRALDRLAIERRGDGLALVHPAASDPSRRIS